MQNDLLNKLRVGEDCSQHSSQAPEREHFQSQLEYFLALLGCLAGFGSFWRFPYLFYKNGGSVFLVPYFASLVLMGAPLLHLESVLGQVSQTTNLRLWERLHPKLRGLGFFAVFVSLLMSIYYNGILTYAFLFLFNSFESPLPWLERADPADVLNQGYFHNQVLQLTPGIEQLGGFQLHIFLFYCFSTGVCIAAIIKGVRFSGKVTLVTASLPYLLLTLLLVRGLFLPGAGEAIHYLLTPDLRPLLGLTIWKDAAIQVFFQLSVGTAAPMMYGSFKERRSPSHNTAWHVCVGIAVCGLISVLIVYVYLFYFIRQSGLAFEDLVLSGPSLAFVVFSQALALLPLQNLWSVIFYATLVLLGVDSQFGLMESFCANLEDLGVCAGDRTKVKKGLGLLLCLTGLSLSFGNGYYMIMYLDEFTCSVPIPLGCLAEAYIFGLRLDFLALEGKLKALTGEGSSPLLLSIITSKYLCGMLAFILAIGLLDQLQYTWSLPFLLGVLGWALTCTPLAYSLLQWVWVQTDFSFEDVQISAVHKSAERKQQFQLQSL